MNFLRKHWPILLILALSIFTHLYRLPSTLTFLEDEARDLLIVKKMVDSGRPIALGPQTSTGNMYLGPLYYYLITPALLLSRFNPVGPALFIALTGILTSYLIYRWGSDWFGKKAGFMASLMFSTMPAPVYMTRNSWNPNLAPLASLIFVFLLHKLLSGKHWSKKNLFFLGITGGVLIQLHYLVLILLLVSAIIYLFTYRRDIKKLLIGFIITFIGFITPLTPFIAFEYKNNYPNFQAITRYLKAADEPNIRYSMPLASWQYRLDLGTTRLLGSLFGPGQVDSKSTTNRVVTYTFLALVTLSLFHKKKTYRLLLSIFLGSLLVLGVYQESVHIHYLGYLFPIVYLILGYLASTKPILRILALLFAFGTIIYSFPITYNYVTTADSIQAIRARDVADYIHQEARGRSYNIVPFRDTQLSAPFEYYLALTDNPPVLTQQPTLFLICVDRPCDQTDYEFEWIFRKGPAHPSIAEYVGHPFYDSFPGNIELVKLDHVSHGIWVAETTVSFDE